MSECLDEEQLDKLILSNGTSIELEAGASLDALRIASGSHEEMLSQWKMLNARNLKKVTIQNGAGLTVGTYDSLVLVSETSVVLADGSILTTYSLREKTDEEKRLDALEIGQEIQNGAISDLGMATSTIADQIGGGV